VVDIGIPDQALNQAEHIYHIPEDDDIFYRLPIRESDIYKHKAGKVFTLCGARGFTGAATMVSEASLVTGAGLVLAGVPESLNSIVESKMTEVITVPLPETADGTYAEAAFELLQEHFDWSHVLALGSGMTQNEETQNLIGKILRSYEKTVVVDADACTYFTPKTINDLKDSPGELILTPHWGEFGKMTGNTKSDLAENRLEIAREFATEFKVTLVLKGAPTIIADASGHVFINPNGNPGMASAGTGDVLAGIVAGLAGQGIPPMDAAVVACYLHGLAGDMAAEDLTQLSLTAGSLIAYLPEAIGFIQSYYEHV
jgi:NAD(P)H-hydrate epimerase